MKQFKRILALCLTVVLLLGNFAPAVYAQETQGDASVQTDDITIEGTNGFGNLLSAEIVEAREEQAESYEGGYTVTDLVIEGNTATVTYDALGEANLIVALYSEDGIQLLTSANALVSAEETEATVTFAGEMPEYFLASAYLVDTYDFSPLCEAYDTPMYTKDMQELLASTVNDYDADRVLQLTEDETTNFAVYAETTKVIEYVDGRNTVASVDEENAVYVIENADEQFTSLDEGDVFAYAYGENDILIVKVSAITVDGTTVTVTGTQMELEEVFAAVKIEGGDSTENAVVDESSLGEGIVYEGLSTEARSDHPLLMATDVGADVEKSLKFKIDEDVIGKDGAKVNLAGSVELSVKISVNYYVSAERQFVEFRIDKALKGAFTITGELKAERKLCDLAFYPFLGLSIGLEPHLVFEVSGKIEFSVAFSNTAGFTYENGDGFDLIKSNPVFEADIAAECTVFLGVDLKPQLEIGEGVLAEFTIELPIGYELEVTRAGSNGKEPDGTEDSYHTCEHCLDIVPSWKLEITAKLQFLKCEWLKVESTPISAKLKLGHLYFSVDHMEIGLGLCPYQSYRVTVLVKDTGGKAREDVAVLRDATPRGQTNSKGTYVEYVPAGKYTYSADVDGETMRETVDVKKALKLTLQPGKDGDNSFTEADSPEDLLDLGSLIDAGFCGAEGSSVMWALSVEGVLTIFGSGDMADYTPYVGGTAPWYAHRASIRKVDVKNGVTSVGEDAFYYHTNLTSVILPDGLKRIEDGAFRSCYALIDVAIPDSVTSIGENAFGYCNGLTEVEIPYSVTSIGDNAFQRCRQLKSAHISASVTSMGDNVFNWCESLTGIHVDAANPNYTSDARGVLFDKEKTVLLEAPGAIEGEYTIPNTVTTIGDYAFQNCRNLTGVNIPESVSTIGNSAFDYCFGLLRVDLPASVTSIETYAFAGCRSLTGIFVADDNPVYSSDERGVLFNKEKTQLLQAPGGLTGEYVIPDTVLSFGEKYSSDQPFRDCAYLTAITIGNKISEIKDYAFGCCENLASVTIPTSVTRIRSSAFTDCDSLTDVYYAGSEAEWNAITIDSSNECLTNATIHYNSTGPASAANTVVTHREAASGEDAPTLDAVYGGEYSTEETGSYTLKKASFSGLVPGEQYLLLAMASIGTNTPLASDNLLYVDQAAAGEDGTLTFTYVQRVTTDPSFVVACGASNKSLEAATITFPDMTADGELHAIDPTVTYEGKTLQEGRDYEITGTVSYTEAGTYVCYIRGVHNYTGTMKCTYIVKAAEAPEEPTTPTEPEKPTEPEPTDPKPTEPEPTDPKPEEPKLEGVIRIAGSDRIGTSLMLADQLKEVLGVEKFEAVVVASALNFPDALTGSYLAAVKDAPILLTYEAAHPQIRAYIQENLKPGGMVYILGGESAVSNSFATGLDGFNVKRVAGSDRFGTNLAIMKEAGVSADQPVLIATALNFADSLSASAAGLPMVLVYGSLRPDQKEFLATTSKNFIIIGGEAAVSTDLEAELKAIGSVERLAGSGRYQTSVMVAQKFVQNPDDVVLAYARNFPDGLCGGPLAYALGAPLILTDDYDPATADAYVEGISAGIVVGGSGLISDDSARAIFDLAADVPINAN